MALTLDQIIHNAGFRLNHIASLMDVPDYALSRLLHHGIAARVHKEELRRVLVDELAICSDEQLFEALDATAKEQERRSRELWNEIVDCWHEDEQEQKRRRRKRKSST